MSSVYKIQLKIYEILLIARSEYLRQWSSTKSGSYQS